MAKRSTNIYSVSVDISQAKAHLDELLKYYKVIENKISSSTGNVELASGFSETINQMKADIDALGESYLSLSKKKVNNSTFTSFSTETIKQIGDLNSRVTTLESTLSKLMGSLSNADASSFKGWISSVKTEITNLNTITGTTIETMSTLIASQSSSNKNPQLLDTSSISDTKSEIDSLIKKINEIYDNAREGKPVDFNGVDDATKQLEAASKTVEKLQTSLSSLKVTDVGFLPTLREYVSALEKLDDISQSANRFGTNNGALNKAFEQSDELITGLESQIDNLKSQMEQLSNASGKTIGSSGKATKITVPIDFSTTQEELQTRLSTILKSLQSITDKTPLEVKFQLVSAEKSKKFNSALNAFEEQIQNIPHDNQRAVMESIANDLRTGFGQQLSVSIKSSVADAEVATRSLIDKIRKQLLADPLIIEPEIKINTKTLEELKSQVDSLAERISTVITDAVKEGFVSGDGEKSIESLKSLKSRVSGLSTLLSKTLPEGVATLDGEFAKLDAHTMGSENAKALAESLNQAYQALEKILSLASGENPLSKLAADWRESDNILKRFKSNTEILERSAVLGSDGKIYGGYVYDKEGSTRGANYTSLPSGVTPKVDIHSHGSDRIVASSMANKDSLGFISGDLYAWAHKVANDAVEHALTIAIDDVELFDAKDFYNAASKRSVRLNNGFNISSIDFTSDYIKNIVRKNYEGMHEYLKKNPLMMMDDMALKYGHVTMENFADEVQNIGLDNVLKDYTFDKTGFIDRLKHNLISGFKTMTGATLDAIEKNLITKDPFDIGDISTALGGKDGIKKLLGLSAYDSRDFRMFQTQQLTPGLFDGSYLKYLSSSDQKDKYAVNLGVRDLFDQYMHRYTQEEFRSTNPLNLNNNQLDGLFKNTGIESFAQNIQTAAQAFQPLVDAINGISNIGEIKINGFTPELSTTLSSISTGLSEVTKILGEAGTFKIDTTPLKELTTTLSELSEVIQKYTGISSTSSLNNTFDQIKQSVESLGNIDLRTKGGKNAISSIIDQYNQYVSSGGTKAISELTDNKKLQSKLQNEFDKVAAQSAQAAAQEAPAMDQVTVSAEAAAEAKKKFAEANQAVFESIVKSVGELDGEGKAFENLNKLINNLGGAKGDEKLQKTKVALEAIRDIMSSPVEANSFLNQLTNFAATGNSLKDLATIINSTKSQSAAAKKALKEAEIADRRARSQELLGDYPSDIKSTVEEELKAKYNKEVPYVSVEIDREGFITATGYIRDFNSAAEDLQVVKMKLDEDMGFVTTGISSATTQAMKYQQFVDRMHKMGQTPSNLTDEIVFDKNADADVWQFLLDEAKQYYDYIGDLTKVTRQVRQDAAGNLLESFSFFGDKGHVTMGREGLTVASHEDLLDVEGIADKYKELERVFQDYYQLKSKYLADPNGTSDYELRQIQLLEEAYKALVPQVLEANAALGSTDNKAQQAFERFNNTVNQNFDKSLETQLNAFQAKLTSVSTDRSNQRNAFTTAFQNQINEAKMAMETIQQLREQYASGQTAWSDADLTTVYNGLQKIKSVMDSFKDRTGIAALTSDVDKLISKVQTDINNNSLKGDLKASYEELLNTLLRVRSAAGTTKDGIAEIDKVTLGKLQGQFQNLHSTMLRTGQDGKGFMKQFAGAITSQSANFLARYFTFYSVIRYGRELANTIKEIDSAMIELRKVSDETTSRLEKSFEKSAQTSKELGTNLTEVINSTADWARLGYGIDQAEELARVTQLYKNVGDNMTQQNASEFLISTLKGFQMDAEEAESIVDKFNDVANNYAIDTAGIGEALKRSASAFNVSHTSLDKSIALITATNTVLQNPEAVGTLWNTMSARLRGATTELQELNEEEDEFTQTTSKLRDLVKGLTGFDIMVDDSTYHDLYDIIIGISKEWKNLTDIQRASLGEALAGKRNSKGLFAVLDNIDTLEDAYKTSMTSAGSAAHEQENYAKSVEYSMTQLKNSLKILETDFLSSDMLKGIVDFGTKILEIIDEIVKKTGALPPLLGLLGGGSLIKGLGNPQRSSIALDAVRALIARGNGIKYAANDASAKLNLATIFANAGNAKMFNDAALVGAMQDFSGVQSAANALKQIDTIDDVAKIELLRTSFEGLDEASASAALGINTAGKSIAIFGSRLGSAFLGLVTNPVTWIAAAVGSLILLKKHFDNVAKEQREAAAEATTAWNSSLTSMSENISKVRELKAELESGTASQERQIEIKDELYNIQSSIVEQYGKEASQIDLINGGLTEQLSLMTQISEAEAKRNLDNNKAAYDRAKREATTDTTYNLTPGIGGLSKSANRDVEEMIASMSSLGISTAGHRISISANNMNAQKALNSYISGLMKLRDSYIEDADHASSGMDYIDRANYVSTIQKYIDRANDVLEDNQEQWESTVESYKSMQEQLFYAAGGGTFLQDLKDAADAYNKALVIGDTDSIDEAAEKYQAAQKAKDAFFDAKKGLNQEEFSELFGDISGGIDKTAEKFYLASKKIQKADRNVLQQRKLQKGGMVDLLNRQMVDADKMRTAYPYFGDDYATVYSSTFSNEAGTMAMNFTPIVVDEDGNVVDVLSEESLQKYAEDVISGTRFDDLKLQIGSTFTGTNAIAQAEEAAEAIHQAQESYFAESVESRKHQKEIADSIEKVAELGLDRVDVAAALTSDLKGSKVKRALSDLAKGLGFNLGDKGELSSFIDLLVKSGYVAGDATDAINNTKTAYSDLKSSVEGAIEAINTVNTAMEESASAAGVSSDSLKALRDYFGDDLNSALETSANGYHINVTAMNELQKKQDELTKSDFLDALSEQYKELYNAEEKLKEAYSEGDAAGVSSWSNSIESINGTITSIQDLIMQYDAATSAYQRFQNAQKNGNERDAFETIQSNYDTVKDLIDRGWTTDDTVTSYLELMTGKTIQSTEEVYAAFDSLSKKIGDTGFSIMDFFTVDDNGKTTSDGVYNFFDMLNSLQGKVGESWVKKLDDGGYEFDFGEGGDQRIADFISQLAGIDIGVEAIQSLIRAARETGFVDLRMEAPAKSIEELRAGAVEAKTALEQLGEAGISDVNLSSAQTFDSITESIKNMQDYIDKVNESDISPEAKTEKLQNANAILEYLISLERDAAKNKEIPINVTAENIDEQINTILAQLNTIRNEDGTVDIKPGDSTYDTLLMLYELDEKINEPKIMSLDLSGATGELAEAVGKVQQLQSEIEHLNSLRQMENQGIDVSAQISTSEQSVQRIAAEVAALSPEIKAKIDINSEELNAELSTIQNVDVTAGVHIPEEAIASVTAAIAAINPDEVKIAINTDDIEKVEAADKVLDNTMVDRQATLTFYTPGLADRIADVKQLKNEWNSIPSNKSTTYTINRVTKFSSEGSGTINGSAKSGFTREVMLNGTAHAHGTAYKGGKWGLVSNQKALINEVGPELVVRGSNWFIPNDGRPTMDFPLRRGDIIFNAKQTEELLNNGYVTRGYAHAEGTAFSSGSGGQRRRNSTSGSSSGSSGKSSGNSNSNTNKAKEAAEEAAEDIKDWVEVLLDRVTHTFENFKEMSEYWTSYRNQNREINNAITQAERNITWNQKAYERYVKQANSVGLNSKYAEQVRNGTISIETIKDEKLREKIDKYTEWYEKARDCADTIRDLNKEVLELSRQKIDNLIEDYESYNELVEKTYENASSLNDLNERKTGVGNVSNLKTMAVQQNALIKEYLEAYARIENEMNAQLKNGYMSTSSKEYRQAQSDLMELKNLINDAQLEIYEINDAIREVNWAKWNEAIAVLEHMNSQLDSTIGLISDFTNFNKDASITENGISQFNLYASALANSRKEIATYTTAISTLDKELKNGTINQATYNEELRDYREKQMAAVTECKKYKDAIIELIKEGIEAETEAMTKLIDKRKEDLQRQKEANDYAKSVAEKNKEITKLQAQIAAMSGDKTMSTQAKVAKLQEDLANKQQELADMRRDHEYDETVKALDDEATKFKEIQDEKSAALELSIANQELAIQETLAWTRKQYTDTYDLLSQIATEYGITLESSLTTPWLNGKNAMDEYIAAVSATNKTAATITTGNNVKANTNPALNVSGAYKESIKSPVVTTTKKAAAPTTKKATTAAKKTTTTTKSKKISGSFSGKQLSTSSANKNDTKYLQKLLNAIMGAGLVVDGDYGPVTAAAVKKFQKKYGLVVDGIFGPKSRSKLLSVAKSKGYARRGKRNAKGLYITDEEGIGTEAIITKEGVLRQLDSDTVFSRKQTEALWDLSKMNLRSMLDNSAKVVRRDSNVNVNYGSLLTVNGNVDKEALPKLQEILRQACEYTKRDMSATLTKMGLRGVL